MCGLVGVINKSKHGMFKDQIDNFHHMLYADAIRGMDGTGMYMVNKFGNVRWMKAKHNPVHLHVTKEYEDTLDEAFKNGQLLIGHNRKATAGKLSDANSHPFVEKHIILVHNGTLDNHKDIGKQEVDSHAICHSMATKGHEETLKTLQGAFALIWYDLKDKKLRICRNSKRPLWLIETHTAWYLASERGLIDWMLSRSTYTIKPLSAVEIEVGQLYEFDIHNCEKYEKTPLTYHTYQTTPLTTYGKRRHGYGGMGYWSEMEDDLPIASNNVSSITEAQTKKQTPALPAPTQTQTGGASTTSYKVGDEVIFCIEDYIEFNQVTENAKYNGRLQGVITSDVNVKVFAFYDNTVWDKINDSLNVIGKIQSIQISKDGSTLHIWLDKDSLRPTWEIESANGIKINVAMWQEIPHQCHCGRDVSHVDIPDCNVVYKANRKKVICPACTESQRKKAS